MSGTEFQVPSVNYGWQWLPDVSTLRDGSFIITWYSRASNSSDMFLYGQKYEANGTKSGGQFQIDQFSSSLFQSTIISSQINDNFIFLWRESNTIQGQIFGSDATKIGNEFAINYTDVPHDMQNFTATSFSDGSFMVVWPEKEDQTSLQQVGISAQRFNSNGAEIGSKFLVNEAWTFDDRDPSVSQLQNGSFVVVWEKAVADSDDSFGIQAKLFNNINSTSGTGFKVNTGTTNKEQSDPNVTALQNGNFVVTWQSYEYSGDPTGFNIRAKIYDSSANALTPEFLVNTYINGDQNSPEIIALNDGGFLITWTSRSHPEGSGGAVVGVYARKFDQHGSSVGDEFLVNTYTPSLQTNMSASPLQDGGFIITWEDWTQDPTDGYRGVYAQRFNSEATKIKLYNNPPDLTTVSSLSTTEDTASSAIAISATDVDGDTLTYSFSNPYKGSVINNSNGTYTYTPNANENGIDTFTVMVSDGTVDISQAVTVTITPLNDAPSLILSSTLSVNEDTVSSTVFFTGIDVDGDTLTYSFSNPSKGSVTNNSNGTYTYTPNANENGSDSFNVTVSDGKVTSSQTVAVIINAVNDAPAGSVTVSGTATQGETLTAVTSTISDEDGLGDFSYQWFAGDVAITNATESTLTLSQAEVDKVITVKVSYTDGYGASEELTSSASAAVVNVNDAPTISTTASLTTAEDTATAAIAFSGTDLDGDTLNFSFSDPAKGSVVNNNDGTFTYTPDANENGADSFTLTVNDGTVDVSQTIDVAIIEKTYTVTVGSAVTGSGNRYFIDGSEAPELILEPGHIYKFDLSHSSTSNHPFDLDVSELDFNLGITTTGSRGSDQIITVTVPDDASGAIDYLCTLHAGMGNTANFKFAQEITISHTDSEANSALYEHQSLVFVSSETEHTTVAMSSGSLGTLSEDLSFMHVELSNSSYDQGISVSDVILQLRDIVGLSTLDGKHKIAADINGDGEIAINDVVSNLRHIVGLDTIKECALVNSADEVVSSLTNSTIADLSIIQYGDVDLSATFLIA